VAAVESATAAWRSEARYGHARGDGSRRRSDGGKSAGEPGKAWPRLSTRRRLACGGAGGSGAGAGWTRAEKKTNADGQAEADKDETLASWPRRRGCCQIGCLARYRGSPDKRGLIWAIHSRQRTMYTTRAVPGKLEALYDTKK